MKTIEAIYDLVLYHAQQLKEMVATTQEEFEREAQQFRAATQKYFLHLRQALPELVQVNYTDVDGNAAEAVADAIIERSKGRYAVDLLATGETLIDRLCDYSNGEDDFATPAVHPWQCDKSSAKNFVIDYDSNNRAEAIEAMNALVCNMLMSLPSGSIHLNIVDLNLTGDAQFFTQHLDHKLLGDMIVDSNKLEELCKSLQGRMLKVMQQCGDLVSYNIENRTVKYPYEVVILLDYPNLYDYLNERLLPLFENGHKGGIYFVVMRNKSLQPPTGRKLLTDDGSRHYAIDPKHRRARCVQHTPIAGNRLLADALFKRLNAAASSQPQRQAATPDHDSLKKTPYKDIVSSIEVPVGEYADGRQAVLALNTVDHVHCFIIGQSGSGKSVFMHNFITGAMLKYSPEDLQFYLLDFKMGGVEFNRYRDAKHVKALLVDNSDVQITLEILRDLREQMNQRGKQLRAAGVDSIKTYNEIHTESRMSQIVFVADECHAMFDPTGDGNRKLFTEMGEIIALVAKEGRSQGVHLVLATQTLAGTEIDNKLLANITDHYLLRCATSDSERMVHDSSRKTAELTVGNVYYHHGNEGQVLQSYYTPADKMQELMRQIVDKAKHSSSNGQYYFNGSQIFTLDRPTLEALPVKRRAIASLGCGISLKREAVNISLKEDDGENLLFFGINDGWQVTRTLMNAVVSLLHTSEKIRNPLQVKVIDCFDDDEAPYAALLDALEERHTLQRVTPHNRGKMLHELAQSIKEERANPTLLVVLGQERFRQLKNDQRIELPASGTGSDPAFGNDGNPFANIFSDDSAGKADTDTFRKALAYILDNGPHIGVHTLLEVDSPTKLLFEEYVSPQYIFTKFNHIVMLRSDEKAAVTLRLSDNIHLEHLSSDVDRLRAYYYAADRDSYQMFTPYTIETIA